MVQYRGQLMPLVSVNNEMRIKSADATQPLLVFSDSFHSMGLVVDEIVDIVEDRLNIEVASERPGVIGSAVIKGQATEIIDIGHFLPLAFEDWFRRKERQTEHATRTLLFVDDSAFFRNMLTPVLKAAGYEVTPVAGAREALSLFKSGRRFDVLVTDLDMPGMDGFALAEEVRKEARLAEMPIIALSAYGSPESIERGRKVGFHDFVAKFDRQSLIAALKEQVADLNQAA
jgi:two-component system chemotaxis sensor kinase CheA